MSPNCVAPEPSISPFLEQGSRSTADSPLSGQRHQAAPLTLVTLWSKSPVFHLKCERKACSGCIFTCGGGRGGGLRPNREEAQRLWNLSLLLVFLHGAYHPSLFLLRSRTHYHFSVNTKFPSFPNPAVSSMVSTDINC